MLPFLFPQIQGDKSRQRSRFLTVLYPNPWKYFWCLVLLVWLVGSLFLKAVDPSFGQSELKFYRLKLEGFLKQKNKQECCALFTCSVNRSYKFFSSINFHWNYLANGAFFHQNFSASFPILPFTVVVLELVFYKPYIVLVIAIHQIPSFLFPSIFLMCWIFFPMCLHKLS